MATISETLDQLAHALKDRELPDDFVDYDNEDWQIFALEYLIANLDEAIEFEDIDTEPSWVASKGYQGFPEDKLFPERMYEGSAFWNMVHNGMKTTGNFKDTLMYIGESLRPEEYEELKKFFIWCIDNNRTFGHGNYWQTYMDFRNPKLPSWRSEIPEEGDV